MKKALCILLVAILVLAAVGLQISAGGKYSRLLLLGDSITYGYGLEGTHESCASYGNLLGEYLGIGGGNFKNAAVNGATSADLLGLLQALAGDVAAADLIVVTIGGNDLLAVLWDAVAAVPGAQPDYAEVARALNDPEYIESLARQITVQAITDAIISYAENLERIVGFIRGKNPHGTVIFLAQYDPASGAGFPEAVSAISSGAIMLLNAAMEEKVTAGSCVWLDIHSLFEGKGLERTFIREGDIHPNTTGHYIIYRFIVEYLETEHGPGETTSDLPEATGTHDTSPAAPETSAPTETTRTKTDLQAPGETTAPAGRLPAEKEADWEKTKRRGCKGSIGFKLVFILIFCLVLPAMRSSNRLAGGACSKRGDEANEIK